MIEVYRNRDYAIVGLIDGLLQSEGIATLLRNRNAVSMTTEIPIPVMFPNICVFNPDDAPRAREIIQAYFESSEADSEKAPWHCPKCDQPNEGNFSECWSCQSNRPNE